MNANASNGKICALADCKKLAELRALTEQILTGFDRLEQLFDSLYVGVIKKAA